MGEVRKNKFTLHYHLKKAHQLIQSSRVIQLVATLVRIVNGRKG